MNKQQSWNLKHSSFYKSARKSQTTQLKGKIEKDLNRNFTKEDIQIDNKHLKRFSISLHIRKMQIEITMRYHYPPRWQKIKKTDNRKCCWGWGAIGTLTQCNESTNRYNHFGNWVLNWAADMKLHQTCISHKLLSPEEKTWRPESNDFVDSQN